MSTASQSGYIVTGVGSNFQTSDIGSMFTFVDGTSSGMITVVSNSTSCTVEISRTVVTQGYNISKVCLNFMGFSAIVAPPAKLNFMGFSVERTVKLSYLNFWGFSAVDAPESFLFYQIN